MEILSNLLSNALKFTRPSGRVEVSTILKGNHRFEIRVTDSGPGIPEEHLPHVFDRFYRVEADSEHSLPGSGLGLALARELTQLLKGKIRVESVVGQGTAFTVDLPATQAAPLTEIKNQQDLRERTATWIPKAGKKSISPFVRGKAPANKPMLLIVEDNEDVVQYLFALLENEYDVVVAYGGKEGFEVATECIPDIILSDVMMPVMDGIQMLGKVKDDLRTSHIPVVMLTAKADIASKLEGLERGADAYIAKPFHREELLLDSDITVEEAAYRTGFKNISHFSKAFTREFNVNPSGIRRE